MTYLASVAVRFRVISRGWIRKVSQRYHRRAVPRHRLIRPIYLRRPHNVASITPSGSINKLQSRDIYRLHTGALFLRPHSPGFFRHGPSIKGTSSPTSARRKCGAPRVHSKSFPMNANADVKSKIKGEKEGRREGLVGKHVGKPERANEIVLFKSTFRSTAEHFTLLTGHPIRGSQCSFLAGDERGPWSIQLNRSRKPLRPQAEKQMSL